MKAVFVCWLLFWLLALTDFIFKDISRPRVLATMIFYGIVAIVFSVWMMFDGGAL
jgi:hypothetical protein